MAAAPAAAATPAIAPAITPTAAAAAAGVAFLRLTMHAFVRGHVEVVTYTSCVPDLRSSSFPP